MVILWNDRKWGMGKMLTHESIASGAWNADFSAATSSTVAWERVLAATPRLLNLTLDRMHANYEALRPKMRKPYGLKEVEP